MAKQNKVPVLGAAPQSRLKAALPPHSWVLNRWSECAAHVAPNTTPAAKHLVRCYRDELVAAGALARLGRELVIFGGPYAAWLAKRTKLVDGYLIKPNEDKNDTETKSPGAPEANK
jgi:hypothetical protein